MVANICFNLNSLLLKSAFWNIFQDTPHITVLVVYCSILNVCLPSFIHASVNALLTGFLENNLLPHVCLQWLQILQHFSPYIT